MNSGQFDMLHDGGHKGVGTVGQGVRLGFQRVLQKAIDQDRPFR